jgi:hypothetical protein
MWTVLICRARRLAGFAIWLSGCGGQAHSAAPAVPETPAASVNASSNVASMRKPFSGEIIYHLTAVAAGTSETRDLGELHYFISGAHWKHVDASGKTTAQYDPDRHLIYYFKSQVETVDASISDRPAKFEALAETRVVLGRKCKGLRWTTADRSITGFYDPELFVDPAQFANHHFGNWIETLTATNGALILWSDMQLPQGDIISDPVSVQPREFDASFWLVPDAQSSNAQEQH